MLKLYRQDNCITFIRLRSIISLSERQKKTFCITFQGEIHMYQFPIHTESEETSKSSRSSRILTREYIKTALLYLLKENSYDKITVTAIINRAGVSRAGFYRNYTSKDEVLEDLAIGIYQKMTSTYLKDLTLDNLYERYVTMFSQLKEHSNWFGILSSVKTYSKVTFGIDLIFNTYSGTLTAEEYYRGIAVFHSQRGIILSWYENGMKESPEEMAAIFYNLYKSQFSV